MILQYEQIAPKKYTYGTHRFCDPRETLKSISKYFSAMGITRIADVTGLDIVGIPVCVSVRPNAKSLAVSQGKGLSLDLAKVSAAMETIELYHAENVILETIVSSYNQLSQTEVVCNPLELNILPHINYDHDLSLHWVNGVDLIQEAELFVPYDLVHCSLLPQDIENAIFSIGSNGLASGNHFLEAVNHGICEVLERDAIHLDSLKRKETNYKLRDLDLNTVDSPSCQILLEKLAQAGLSTYVWDLTADVGAPVFGCAIFEAEDTLSLHSVGIFHGYGCHLSKEIAFIRAVTEAVQTRLTYISGARDDIYREGYEITQSEFFQARWKRFLTRKNLTIDFKALPSLETANLDTDNSILLDLLKKTGLNKVIVVDLTQPQFNIAVVRVIIPGTGISLHGTVTKLSQRMKNYATN